MELAPFLVSLKLALVTLLFVVIIGLPIVYWFHFTKSKVVRYFGGVLNLPIVLPPSVIGFYLLLVYSKLEFISLAFSFSGLVLASVIYNLAFFINPILSGLDHSPKRYQYAAEIMGKSQITIFFKVLLPNVKSSILSALVLTLAHTIGEFGIVLMIGGGISGKTEVASIALYNEVESLNYDVANQYALVLIAFSLFVITLLQFLKPRFDHVTL